MALLIAAIHILSGDIVRSYEIGIGGVIVTPTMAVREGVGVKVAVELKVGVGVRVNVGVAV